MSKVSTLLTMTNGFCESALYADETHPEYINSITALYMVLFGSYGLYNLPANSVLSTNWRMIYSFFLLNGIGSCGYHYTSYFVFKFLDEFTMIMAIYCAVYQNISNLSYQYFIMLKKYNYRIYHNFMNTLSVFLFSVLSITVTFIAVDFKTNDAAAIAFTVGAVLLALAVTISLKILHAKQFGTLKSFKELKTFLKINTCVSVLAFFLWWGTEPWCDDIEWIKYGHFHALWHFGGSFAAYGFSVFGMFIDFYSYGYKPKLKTGFSKYIPYVHIQQTKSKKKFR